MKGATLDQAIYASAWKTSAFGLPAEIRRILAVWERNGVPDTNLRLIHSYVKRAPDFQLSSFPNGWG